MAIAPKSIPVVALVDRRPSVCVNGHQLHRPSDSLAARALSQAPTSLDKFRLRQPRHRIPRGLFGRAEAPSARLSPDPHRHATRGLTLSVIWYSLISMLYVISAVHSTASRRFGIPAGTLANQQTGLPPPGAVSGGSPSASAPWRPHCSTADPSIGGAVAHVHCFVGFILAGGGDPHSWFPACSAFCG